MGKREKRKLKKLKAKAKYIGKETKINRKSYLAGRILIDDKKNKTDEDVRII